MIILFPIFFSWKDNLDFLYKGKIKKYLLIVLFVIDLKLNKAYNQL